MMMLARLHVREQGMQMTPREDQRRRMIEHLQAALDLADGLNDSLTGYLIERALDEARAGGIEHARNAGYS